MDAYTGEVVLYEWTEDDPMLDAWMSAFPGTIQPRDEVPEDLLDHLRYPEDMFKVQRDILDRYHVEDSGDFYNASDLWAVPGDPADTASGTVQPPYYLSVQMPGESEPTFSLTSVYTPNERQNLAAFVAVNSDASDPDYGQMTILEPDTQIVGPDQVANEFQNDPEVADALLEFRQNEDFSILYGNLLTLPAGDGLLYVQPIYTQRATAEGAGVFPLLQYVVASFGEEVGIGRSLDEALEDALGEPIGSPEQPPTGNGAPQNDPPNNQPGNPSDTERALELLAQADQVYAQAQAALQAGELGEYQTLIEQYNDLVSQAGALLSGSGGSAPPGDGSPGDPPPGDGPQSTSLPPSGPAAGGIELSGSAPAG